METATPNWQWWRWKSHRDVPALEAEMLVATWKAAWLKGANAAWANTKPLSNPFETERERAAWQAGRKWAEQNPNRRADRAPRFAHPLRRATDATLSASLKRAATVGATGVTVYALSKLLRRWSRASQNNGH